jgi:hypothetical protein
VSHINPHDDFINPS